LAERIFGRRTEQVWRWPEQPAAPEVEDAAEPGVPGTPPAARPEPTLPSEPARVEFSLTDAEGSERIFELHVFPLPDTPRFLALSLDRTRAVHDQRRLMLTERLASLGRTVQGVAHELNTPLATIQTLGRDVVDAVDTGGLPEAMRADLAESANMIVAEVQRCRRITHALLGRVERFDARDGAETSLVEAIERAAAVVFPSARHRVTLHFEPGTERARRPLDPVVQIFVNLLQNARDAAPEGHVTLSAERVLSAVVAGVDLGEAVCVQVRDQGPGFTEGAIKHLFEPFYTTKPPGRGTGLGLYTSYGLARSLGAELSLENHPEGGAVATLLVPIEAPPSPVDAAEI
jgi:signal transduction histidine kinase